MKKMPAGYKMGVTRCVVLRLLGTGEQVHEIHLMPKPAPLLLPKARSRKRAGRQQHGQLRVDSRAEVVRP